MPKNNIVGPAVTILSLWILCFTYNVYAQSPRFSALDWQTNDEVSICLSSTAGSNYCIQVSTNLQEWQPLVTLQSTGLQQHVDSAGPYLQSRFYGAFVSASGALTGDHFATAEGNAVMHLFAHASFLISWNSIAIYVDPVDTALVSKGFPRAGLILVTHDHSDHYNRTALNNLTNASTSIVAPLYVYNNLVSNLSPLTNLVTVLTNGVSAVLPGGITVEAVWAYNANHPKGRGNGYIVTMGGQRLYISGDTDKIAEILTISNIDIAFVCMDGVFNMNLTDAADAVRTIRPKVVYPYHYNTATPATFKGLVGTDLVIEVRLRK